MCCASDNRNLQIIPIKKGTVTIIIGASINKIASLCFYYDKTYEASSGKFRSKYPAKAFYGIVVYSPVIC